MIGRRGFITGLVAVVAAGGIALLAWVRPVCEVRSRDHFAAHVAYCVQEWPPRCTPEQYRAACLRMFSVPGNSTTSDGSVAWRTDDVRGLR